MSNQGARVGKGKAVHLYFAGSAQVACGADGMIAGTATPCDGEITCKRCLKVAPAPVAAEHLSSDDAATSDVTPNTYPTVEAALAEPVEHRAGEYLVRWVKAGWYAWQTDADLDEAGAYGFDDEYELVELEADETATVIPLDVALALVAAQVITHHTDPVERDRAADVLRSLEGGGSVTNALDVTQFSGTLPTNPPVFVDTSEWDDRDNG